MYDPSSSEMALRFKRLLEMEIGCVKNPLENDSPLRKMAESESGTSLCFCLNLPRARL